MGFLSLSLSASLFCFLFFFFDFCRGREFSQGGCFNAGVVDNCFMLAKVYEGKSSGLGFDVLHTKF